MIGALAIFTIGAVFLAGIAYFGFFLSNPRNRAAAKNVASGGKAASTQLAEDAPEGSYHDRNLKERLDDSLSSGHPYNPEKAKQGVGDLRRE